MLYSRQNGLLKICLIIGLFFLGYPNPQAALPNMEKMLQLAQARYGSMGVLVVNQWREMLAKAKSEAEAVQLAQINDFFNRRIVFEDDPVIWGKTDYWATPLETMGRGRGDCEDFAIAKYVSLRGLGVSIDKLRMTYVRAQLGTATQAHMVLAYYSSPDADPLILDNVITEIRPASRRSDLTPVFSFNSEGLWLGNGKSEKKSDNPTARLSRWRDVIARMQNEGVE